MLASWAQKTKSFSCPHKGTNQFIIGTVFDNALLPPEFKKAPVPVNLEMTLADVPFRNDSVESGTITEHLRCVMVTLAFSINDLSFSLGSRSWP